VQGVSCLFIYLPNHTMLPSEHSKNTVKYLPRHSLHNTGDREQVTPGLQLCAPHISVYLTLLCHTIYALQGFTTPPPSKVTLSYFIDPVSNDLVIS
jgi:hypothetical protein